MIWICYTDLLHTMRISSYYLFTWKTTIIIITIKSHRWQPSPLVNWRSFAIIIMCYPVYQVFSIMEMLLFSIDSLIKMDYVQSLPFLLMVRCEAAL